MLLPCSNTKLPNRCNQSLQQADFQPAFVTEVNKRLLSTEFYLLQHTDRNFQKGTAASGELVFHMNSLKYPPYLSTRPLLTFFCLDKKQNEVRVLCTLAFPFLGEVWFQYEKQAAVGLKGAAAFPIQQGGKENAGSQVAAWTS